MYHYEVSRFTRDEAVNGGAKSRVCAVAQYTVLEANAEVNGRGPFSHPHPPKPLNQFQCYVKYITTSPQGVDVQNLVGIDLAVTDLRMREKTRFVWIFLNNYCKKT